MSSLLNLDAQIIAFLQESWTITTYRHFRRIKKSKKHHRPAPHHHQNRHKAHHHHGGHHNGWVTLGAADSSADFSALVNEYPKLHPALQAMHQSSHGL